MDLLRVLLTARALSLKQHQLLALGLSLLDEGWILCLVEKRRCPVLSR